MRVRVSRARSGTLRWKPIFVIDYDYFGKYIWIRIFKRLDIRILTASYVDRYNEALTRVKGGKANGYI